ncbi:MAG: CPXCG motif-containing cysteine-rich protein [Zhongshania sp.]|uniref:CPXCG motif-containing cysteine-rich protein n=1 Tax=Zhongshania sp. TaxID=1971902 RepID=UPI002634A6A9|nr:CPXCG motif-containing cysteine-rich protein [Zhongshania sp.]MDF1692192.1 CPXCG motif-containing cysteine-rich protein [Zhongshania sp.]
MNALESVVARCPYCGERVELLVDSSEGEQQYTEDCEVCCRPMVVSVAIDEDELPRVQVFSENDAF